MITYRQINFNEPSFGENIGSFDAVRFVDSKPFGGGWTPRRFVVQQTFLTFIAMLLHHFDIEMSEQQRFPKADEGTVLGVMETLDEVTSRIRHRGTCHLCVVGSSESIR